AARPRTASATITAAIHDVPPRDEDDGGSTAGWIVGAAESRCTRTAPYTRSPNPRWQSLAHTQTAYGPSETCGTTKLAFTAYVASPTARAMSRCPTRIAFSGRWPYQSGPFPGTRYTTNGPSPGSPVPGQVSMCADRPIACSPGS